MGAKGSFEGSTDIPKSMRAARGVPTSWKREGRCHPSHRPDTVPYFAFTVEPNDKGPLLLDRPAETWIALALLVCRGCPAQYGCARFAVAADEKFGTWSMPVEELLWLKKYKRAGVVIDVAEAEGIPMQDAVQQAHRATV